MAASEHITWRSTSLSSVAGRCAIKPRSAGKLYVGHHHKSRNQWRHGNSNCNRRPKNHGCLSFGSSTPLAASSSKTFGPTRWRKSVQSSPRKPVAPNGASATTRRLATRFPERACSILNGANRLLPGQNQKYCGQPEKIANSFFAKPKTGQAAGAPVSPPGGGHSPAHPEPRPPFRQRQAPAF